jgi:hypothetical protein
MFTDKTSCLARAGHWSETSYLARARHRSEDHILATLPLFSGSGLTIGRWQPPLPAKVSHGAARRLESQKSAPHASRLALCVSSILLPAPCARGWHGRSCSWPARSSWLRGELGGEPAVTRTRDRTMGSGCSGLVFHLLDIKLKLNIHDSTCYMIGEIGD